MLEPPLDLTHRECHILLEVGHLAAAGQMTHSLDNLLAYLHPCFGTAACSKDGVHATPHRPGEIAVEQYVAHRDEQQTGSACEESQHGSYTPGEQFAACPVSAHTCRHGAGKLQRVFAEGDIVLLGYLGHHVGPQPADCCDVDTGHEGTGNCCYGAFDGRLLDELVYVVAWHNSLSFNDSYSLCGLSLAVTSI